MNYSLHPEALGDLRDAASSIVRKLALVYLNPSLESLDNRSIASAAPCTWFTVARTRTTEVRNEALPVFAGLYSIR